jgi:selenide,water dikinase
LRRLHNSSPATHPDLLIGIQESDDAGVFLLSDELALVQTVDFFTPIVDDARDWGRIAAANALSDVYAMAATPVTALQVVGWPRRGLSFDLLGEVLEGGVEILAEAGCALAGGHTIDDPEPKYGLAVTGVVHPDDFVSNAGARPGDALLLTKPLGTGLIATAIKRGIASEAQSAAAIESMVALNAGASRAMRRVGVTAATDVTGFGLLGHLGEMVRASRVSATIEAAAVPLLPGVVELAAAGVVPGGTDRNMDSARRFTRFIGIADAVATVLADAQTSGGLLVSVDAPLEKALHQALVEEGVAAVTIGRVREREFSDGPSGGVEVR